MNYEVKVKRTDTGRWWGVGNVRLNKWGNPQLGLRYTKELHDWIAAHKEGDWLNLSLFEPKQDREPTNHTVAKANAYQAESDDAPF